MELLNPHSTLPKKEAGNIIIRPRIIPFISYPYEWCFGEFKDAALATLTIETIALLYGYTLKDASAYNIQFINGKPLLIDKLSFEPYKEGSLWIAYRQFCIQFLAPLLLMSYLDPDMNKRLLFYFDGVPLSLVSKLLPKHTYLNFSHLMHIHFQALMERKSSGQTADTKTMSKSNLFALLHDLQNTIENLKFPVKKSYWSEYEKFHIYNNHALSEKQRIVGKYLAMTKAKTALDIGANTGMFTKLCTDRKIRTVSIDNDHVSIEQMYETNKKNNDQFCLPLVIDITNPSPSIGWANGERMSFITRSSFDVVLALAITHHLAIEHNLPLEYIMKFMSHLGTYGIIEFVPKTDPEVRTMLANREDIFHRYSQQEFEKACGKYYSIIAKQPVDKTGRVIYFLKRKKYV